MDQITIPQAGHVHLSCYQIKSVRRLQNDYMPQHYHIAAHPQDLLCTDTRLKLKQLNYNFKNKPCSKKTCDKMTPFPPHKQVMPCAAQRIINNSSSILESQRSPGPAILLRPYSPGSAILESQRSPGPAILQRPYSPGPAVLQCYRCFREDKTVT
jgi:hypothetical protein